MFRSIDDYKSELMSMYNKLPEVSAVGEPDAAYGWLIVVLTTQKGTFPLENAKVTVKDSDNTVLYSQLSDRNGKTEKMRLESVPKGNSENPENTKNVAKYYNVFITADGFVPISIEGVPVFEGVTSVQSFDMIFKAGAENDEVQTVKFRNEYTL